MGARAVLHHGLATSTWTPNNKAHIVCEGGRGQVRIIAGRTTIQEAFAFILSIFKIISSLIRTGNHANCLSLVLGHYFAAKRNGLHRLSSEERRLRCKVRRSSIFHIFRCQAKSRSGRHKAKRARSGKSKCTTRKQFHVSLRVIPVALLRVTTSLDPHKQPHEAMRVPDAYGVGREQCSTQRLALHVTKSEAVIHCIVYEAERQRRTRSFKYRVVINLARIEEHSLRPAKKRW